METGNNFYICTISLEFKVVFKDEKLKKNVCVGIFVNIYNFLKS